MSADLANTATSVIDGVAIVLYVLILARILISWLPIHPWHPIVRWLRIIVDPILAPFRRVLPAVAGLDLSPLLAILVIFFVDHLATGAIRNAAFGAPLSVPALVVSLLAQLVESVIIILGILVLVRFLLALFSADPFHPLVAGIRSMTNVLVRPFASFGRRRALTGFDVPALLTLILYAALYVVVQVVFANLLVKVL